MRDVASAADSGREIMALTGLRWFAVSVVFLRHYPHLLSFHPALHFFFTLSGFLMTYIYMERFRKGEISASEFHIRRFSRLFPLFLAISLVQTAALILGDTDSAFEPAAIIIQLAMLQGLFDDIKFETVPTGWTLSTELGFYLAVPLLFPAIGRLSRRNLFMATLPLTATTLGLLILGKVILLTAPHPYGFFATDFHWLVYTSFGRFFDFATGVFVGLLILDHRFKPILERPIWSNLCAALGIALWVLFGYLLSLSEASESSATLLVHYIFPISSGLIVLSLCGRGALAFLLSRRPVAYLGKLSYAFFLLHFLPIMVDFFRAVKSQVGNYWLSILILYCSCWALSFLCFTLIEDPAQRWIRRMFSKRHS